MKDIVEVIEDHLLDFGHNIVSGDGALVVQALTDAGYAVVTKEYIAVADEAIQASKVSE